MRGVGRAILAVNAGSSSLKLGMYGDEPGGLRLLARVHVTGIGQAAQWSAVGADGVDEVEDLGASATHTSALKTSLEWLRRREPRIEFAAVGHRVVHGGARFSQPIRITDQVLEALREFNELAPLHEPHNIKGIEAMAEVEPDVAQVACFDTAFHHTVSGPASTFALPRSLTEGEVRRYGFHGLSYQYIASVLPSHLGDAAEGRVIVAHLGHGASMCAMRERRSVATTMGMTPLDGLPMGTRSGSVDPGMLIYLQQSRGMSVEEINRLLYFESGLLGISGVSPYMDVLLESGDPRAAEAVEYYVYWSARTIGSLAAALGGLDAIVFTAGVGEHSAEVRRRILQACSWLGVAVDTRANDEHGPQITKPSSSVSGWVIPTDEEIVVAQATLALVQEDD